MAALKNRRRPKTAEKDPHRLFLELVDRDGPFLAIPPLKRVWPQGFPQLDPTVRGALAAAKPAIEGAWDRWDAARQTAGGSTTPGRETDRTATLLADYRQARDAWVRTVLDNLFGWADLTRSDDPRLTQWLARAADYSVEVTPTLLVARGDTVAALVWVIDPVDSLRDVGLDGWAASPIERMEAMLRAAGVPVGLVTDGRWWGLVSTPAKSLPASGIVDSFTWIEEPATRNALAALLSAQALFGGQPKNRLPTLFDESVLAAEQITESLGVQVRAAVELLVAAFSEAAADAVLAGLPEPLPHHDDPAYATHDGQQIYSAAVTVMMRVVFLLFAEQRDLLPEGRLFVSSYGLSSQLDDLEDRARHEGEEALDGTYLVWHRLLATSRLLYGGATFEDVRLPGYGGSLFDPAQYSWLETRTPRGALTVRVSDRVMWKVLDAVQVARVRGQLPRRVSFRDIDVEQIGYIYEGLLGYTATRADEPVVGLLGKPGAEPDVPLHLLVELADRHTTPNGTLLPGFVTALLGWLKKNQPASQPATKAQLTKALAATDGADQALFATSGDAEVRDTLAPFAGIIRRDLRNRLVVIDSGDLYVTETPSRRNAGAHYTPSKLAQEVVLHALEPLCYSPGPYDTPDRTAWRPKSATQILNLKIADIACGSGAFLVAAARYLAGRVVAAWQHSRGTGAAPAQDLEIEALRQVVARCLYGADINPMAVEMCKLSLWLISLDRHLPFSFVDDKIFCGDSLLGLTDRRQLEVQHLYPERTTTQFQTVMRLSGDLVDRLDLDRRLTDIRDLRAELATEVREGDPQRSTGAKERQVAEINRLADELRRASDFIVATGLRFGGKPDKKLDEAHADARTTLAEALPADGADPDWTRVQQFTDKWLAPTVPADVSRWQPLHWFLDVPDVRQRGGFDAIVGNPPFLGGKKISGAVGGQIRDWYVNVLAEGQRGNADLVAYFVLRAIGLLAAHGTIGLIATNTLGQGDTREVGLDRIVADGFTITRAVQSRPWPSQSANLEYAAVWGSKGAVATDAKRVSDDLEVPRINTLLEPAGRVDATPQRLAENRGIAFIGCYVLGLGFVIDPDTAQQWIDDDPKNAEVLFPYLTGEDLNSRPDSSASRWVIDFFDRSEATSARFRTAFRRVQKTVFPERQVVNRKVHRERWWQYADKRPALRKAIARLDEVLAIALVSNTVMLLRVPKGQVFAHKLGVFATSDFGDQAILSSTQHQLWAIRNGSTLGAGVNYSPSDVFDTFPRPPSTPTLAEIGHTLDTERREIMLRRDLGLTKLYNRINDPDVSNSDADVARMREIHVDLDQAVMAAYGWGEVPLDHGFHTYRQMTRWTVSPAARVEIIDRLLEENLKRAAAQQTSGDTTLTGGLFDLDLEESPDHAADDDAVNDDAADEESA